MLCLVQDSALVMVKFCGSQKIICSMKVSCVLSLGLGLFWGTPAGEVGHSRLIGWCVIQEALGSRFNLIIVNGNNTIPSLFLEGWRVEEVSHRGFLRAGSSSARRCQGKPTLFLIYQGSQILPPLRKSSHVGCGLGRHPTGPSTVTAVPC